MIFGQSVQQSDLNFALQDQLSGMGDYLDTDVGSLNWIECYVMARANTAMKQFLTLMSNQLTPASASVFMDRWSAIYSVGNLNLNDAKKLITLKQSEFGSNPTATNLTGLLSSMLGNIFIDVEVAPELIGTATNDPVNQIVLNGGAYQTPLATNFLYIWQPRDNADNNLMTNQQFQSLSESYKQIVKAWNPVYVSMQTLNLQNRGFQDGYGNNYNGTNFNNYLDGYNVVSSVAGSTSITGVGTAFKTYPDGSSGDFQTAVTNGYYPPIQIVDDAGVLQTYYVSSVASNTSLTVTQPIVNNITSRTYRALGICLDSDGALDSGMLFGI